VNIEYRWAEEGRYEKLPTVALRDLAPKIGSGGLLVNPHNPNAVLQTKEMEVAGYGQLQLKVQP
jgi:hypothetical protein